MISNTENRSIVERLDPVNLMSEADAEPPASPSAMFAGLLNRGASQNAANDESAPTKPKRVHPASAASSEERAELRNVIAPRLLAARRNAGLGQHELALMLGMQSPAPLNQWEQGRRHLPVDKLVLLADALHCSCDYLLGRSTDATRDPAEGLRHAVLRGVRAQLSRTAEVVIDEIARHTRLVGSNAATVDGVLAAADKLLDAQATWQRLNLKAFETQRGGATVVAACETLEKAVLDMRQKVQLHRALDGDLERALAALPHADPVLPGDEGAD